MRNYFIYFICFFLASGCQNKNSYSTSCPLLVGPAGAQLFMSLESARSLCKDRIVSVNVVKMEKSPQTGALRSGDVYTILENDSTLLISKASDKYYTPPESKGGSFLMHKGIGEYAYWLGYEEIEGIYFYMDSIDARIQKIGYEENKYRITSEGRHILMSRGMGEDDFFAGDADGKIYKAVGTENVEQVGVFDYFIIALENAQPSRWLVMTKGMNENDKWFGELDGVIYVSE